MSDTSEITNGCLVHYDSSHIQTRRDFMGLCKYNRDQFEGRRKQEPNQECMAKIVRLIETLTDHAKAEWKIKALAAEEKGLSRPREPKRYPISLSNGVIIRLIYETFGESTVRNSLNYLLEIGYIGRSQATKNAIPLYWLEQEYVQVLLQAQAEVILAGYEFRPPSYQGAISYPGGVISNPSAVNSRPGHSHPGSEITDNNIDNRDDISSEIEKEREGANAPTPAHLKKQVDEKLEEVKTASGKHKAVSSHSQAGLQEEEQPTVKLAAVGTSQQKPGTRSLPLVATPLSGGQGDTSAQASSEPVPSQDGAAPAANPPASSGPRASWETEPDREVIDVLMHPEKLRKPFVVPARPQVVVKQRDLMPEPKPPTDKQINDRRAKEIWTLIESKLETTFLANQRKASKHTKGIEHLIEDQVTDETIEAGLSRLDQWEIDRFSVNRFYELLPGLLAKHRPGANNNTPPAKQGDQEYGVSGLPKLKPLGSVK